MDKHAYVIIVSAKHSGHLKASDLRLNGSWCTATPKEIHVNECDFLTFSLIYPSSPIFWIKITALRGPRRGQAMVEEVLAASLLFNFYIFF